MTLNQLNFEFILSYKPFLVIGVTRDLQRPFISESMDKLLDPLMTDNR